MAETKFEIVAFPQGRREVVGVAWCSSLEVAVKKAIVQAKVRREFVDVEVGGDRVAIVSWEGWEL